MTATDARQPPPTAPPGLEAESSEESPVRRRTARTLRIEHFAWAGVLLIALLYRFADLESVPLSAGEGGRALESWSVAQGRLTNGWPGGVIDAVTALLLKLFGGADGTARFASAVAGVLLVASFWLLRPHVGRGAALLAAFLAAVSPIFVLDARLSTSDAAGAALAVVLTALVLRFLERPRPRMLVGIVVILCFGLATDAVFLGAVLLIALWTALRGLWVRDEALSDAWQVLRRYDEWARSAVPLGLARLLLATSRFGLGFARLRPAVARSWALAFTPSRAGAPWHYLLDVLIGYEPLIALLGAAGVWLVVRRRAWRTEPASGLLLVWLAGGLGLNFFTAGRLASSLLLSLLPLCVFAGVGLTHLIRACAAWRFEIVDLIVGVGLAIACVYFYTAAERYAGTEGGSGPEVLAGVLLLAVCLVALGLRTWQEGAAQSAPALGVLLVVGLFCSVHGASSLAFGTGDEFALGQRTTPEGAAMARLLVHNGGGVSTVTDQALPDLAWYLRDTVQSGGHGGAQIVAGGAQVPAGFHAVGTAATISRTWSPPSWSGRGMIRWWVYREAWGGPSTMRNVDGQLVVEDR